MTERPAMHTAVSRNLGMALWKAYKGVGGGGSVFNIPLLIIYEEKYPEIIWSRSAVVLGSLPAPPPDPSDR